MQLGPSNRHTLSSSTAQSSPRRARARTRRWHDWHKMHFALLSADVFLVLQRAWGSPQKSPVHVVASLVAERARWVWAAEMLWWPLLVLGGKFRSRLSLPHFSPFLVVLRWKATQCPWNGRAHKMVTTRLSFCCLQMHCCYLEAGGGWRQYNIKQL